MHEEHAMLPELEYFMARSTVGHVSRGRYYKSMAKPNDYNEGGMGSIEEPGPESLKR